MTELLRLFGCRFADSRAEGAPQLRREAGVNHAGVLAVEVAAGSEADVICKDGWAYRAVEILDWGWQRVPEAYLHDERVLPHQVFGDLEAIFPRAIAGKEELEEREALDGLEERCRVIGQMPRVLK